MSRGRLPDALSCMETIALRAMTVPLTLPGLGCFLFICWGLYLAVKIIRMPLQRPGVERDSKPEKQPDGMGGIVAVVLCTAFLVFLIIVPDRKGTSHGGKFYLAALALWGIGWGLRQLRAARVLNKREAEAAKEKDRGKAA